MGITIGHVTAEYWQEKDGNDDGDMQRLVVELTSCGDKPYMVVKTERWAMTYLLSLWRKPNRCLTGMNADELAHCTTSGKFIVARNHLAADGLWRHATSRNLGAGGGGRHGRSRAAGIDRYRLRCRVVEYRCYRWIGISGITDCGRGDCGLLG